MVRSRIYSIYALRCKTNSKLYIGRTTNMKQRINNHFDNLKGKSHPIKSLQEDFNKYGLEDFEIYLLEENIPYENRYREYEYMKEYNTFDEKYGYNQGDFKKSQKKEYVIKKEKPLNVFKNDNSIKQE